MTALLEKALTRVSNLPEQEQDFFASIIMQEIDSEERWDSLFADPRSQPVLDQMAAGALAEFAAGRTVSGGFGDA